MKMARMGLGVLLLWSVSASGHTGAKKIEVISRWGGLGKPHETVITIIHEKQQYRAGRNTVPDALVDNLQRCIAAEVVPKPDLSNMGVDESWLRNHDDPPFGLGYEGYKNPAPNQQALYQEAFRDVHKIAALLPRIFGTSRSDDYPSATVTVTFENGSTASASSHSWDPFMLPWKVLRDGREATTFNAQLSKAVSALLPSGGTNKERLAGEDFPEALARTVFAEIEPQLEMLDVENRAPAALAILRSRYTVMSADINPYHHPEYGNEWDGKHPKEVNLHASVRKASFPVNFTDAVVLEMTDKGAVGTSEFLSKAGRYEELVLGTPWLREYMENHPNVAFRLSYVHSASFGEKAWRVFNADMQAIGRQELLNLVQQEGDRVALLIVGRTYAESYWLVLPDHRATLWRFGGPSGLLKWKPGDFTPKDCSEYQGVTGGCVGAIVDEGGRSMSDSAYR